MVRHKTMTRCGLIVELALVLFGGLIVSAQQGDLPLYSLPGAGVRVYSSSTIALATDGIAIATNMLNNTVSFVHPMRGDLLAEVPVGKDPRTVALTPDGTRVLVVNRGDGTLSVLSYADRAVVRTIALGVLPYAVVTNSNSTAYVSVQGSDEVILVDLETGKTLERYAVPDSPAGLALWGDFLYVTHLWSGDLSLIYLPQKRVAKTISTGLDTTLSLSIEIDSTNGLAYLPQSRANAQTPALTYDTTIWPVVNVVDLSTLNVLNDRRITLDTVDRPVNMPLAARYDSVRRWLYVINAGSNDISVINLNTGLVREHIQVGANPRGIVPSRDNAFVYVHNVVDGSITIIAASNLQVTDLVPVSDLKIPVDILIGAQLFYSSADPRLSDSGWISCASCHFDGQSDGRTWQGFPGGPRNTPALYNLVDTPPYTWTGAWDDLADVEIKIRGVMNGTGLIDGPLDDLHSGQSLDMDTLTAYLATLQGPPNPMVADATVAGRGAAVFAEQGCANCHTGTSGTDLQQYDVDTGGTFDTPTLRWLWITAPYFHDGRADTLRDVFVLPGSHQLIRTLPAEDIDALVEYLLSLP